MAKKLSSTRFQNTLWNKIDLDRTSKYIDGLIDTVFVGRPTWFQFYNSDAQIQNILNYITEVYRLNRFAGSLHYLITLLKYTLFYYIVELNTKKITLLSYTQS